MAYETLVLKRSANVVTILLSKPGGMYMLTRKSITELGNALATCEFDPDIRAVVITSDSKAFCAGAEIETLDEMVERRSPLMLYGMVDEINDRVTLPIARMAKPVIAAVNGVAAGGGLGLALSCDMRIAADTARFVVAYGNIGLSPDAGTSFFLPRLVGTAKALELYALNDRLSAEQALGLGLVNRVVPAANLMEATQEFAQRLASTATVAYGQTKLLMNSAFANDLGPHLKDETRCMAICHVTADHREGLVAFHGKRLPQFAGH